jgi:tetratricopeptide (TPR) repeat protein
MTRHFLLRSLLSTAVVALLSVTVATGQQSTSPGSSTGSRPSPGTPSPNIPGPNTRPNIPTTQPRSQDQTPFPEIQRPLYLSGKVLLDDGTPPPDFVTIETVCNGVVRPQGMTDSKGRFSFELNRNAALFMDASVSGSDMANGGMMPSRTGTTQPGIAGMPGQISERQLMGCDLRASLPGFRSDTLNLTGRRFMDNPDVGTIVLHRLGNVEGLTISATSLAAPKDAKKAFDKGREALKKNKIDEAEKQFSKAVELYPKYAAAWNQLGMVQDHKKDYEAARKSFSEALAADSKFISPYDGLAQLAARENKWEEVADVTDRMIRLNPVDFPRAYFLNSVAKLNLGKLDAAEESVNHLIQMDPQHRYAKAEHVLGVILAQKNDYDGAATHIRKFLELAPPGADLELAKKQLAQLEQSLAAKQPPQK